MTNKRKQRIRSIAKSTETSHAEAANLLRKKGPRVKPWTGPIEGLFIEDLISWVEPATTPLGDFIRVTPYSPYYEKRGKAFVIGELGETILCYEQGDKVVVPWFEVACEVPHDNLALGARNITGAIRDRMSALLDAIYVDGYDTPKWVDHRIPRHALNGFFRGAFKEQEGTIHVFEQNGNAFGIMNHAGIHVTEGPPILVRGSGEFTMMAQRVGLAAFKDRVKGVKVV